MLRVNNTSGFGAKPAPASGSTELDDASGDTYVDTGDFCNTDRSSFMTCTHSGFAFSAGSAADLIDGTDTDFGNFPAGATDSGDIIMVDFGAGASVAVERLSFVGSSAVHSGTWKFEQSQDAVNWTETGAATVVTVSARSPTYYDVHNASSLAGRYWRMKAVDGNFASGPSLREIEFAGRRHA